MQTILFLLLLSMRSIYREHMIRGKNVIYQKQSVDFVANFDR